MADHYGTAIVPTRVRKPRDKAAVESAVNTVNKRVIGYLAEEVWTTLAELNDAIAERVHEINHDIRRADGSTRFERFTDEEAPLLAQRCRMRCSSTSSGSRPRSGATTTSPPTTSTTRCPGRWPGSCCGCG